MENKQTKFEEAKSVNDILQEQREKQLGDKIEPGLAEVIVQAQGILEVVVPALETDQCTESEFVRSAPSKEQLLKQLQDQILTDINAGLDSWDVGDRAGKWNMEHGYFLSNEELHDLLWNEKWNLPDRYQEALVAKEAKGMRKIGYSFQKALTAIIAGNVIHKRKISALKTIDIVIQEYGENPTEAPKYRELSNAIVDMGDFLKIEFPERKVIISPWLKEQSITLISGWRGSGKTFFSLTLALCAVGGLDYSLSKWNVINTVPTLYIDAEMVGDDIQKRFHKLETDKCNKEKLLIYSDHYANLQGLPPARLGDAEWRQVIRNLILENKIKLVFFDNISALCPEIDENLKHIWGPINSWLLELRYAGVASVLDHHTGKKGDQRGISGREDSIDNSILLSRPLDYSDKDGCKFNLHFTKCRGVNDADRRLIPDTEFWLKDEDEYHSIWECGTVSKKKFIECVHMLSSGMSYTKIVKNLGIRSKSQITKYLQQAQVKGYLTIDKKLTESGRALVKTLSEYDNNWQEIDDKEIGE